MTDFSSDCLHSQLYSWFTVMQIILSNQTSYLVLRKLYSSWTLDTKTFFNYLLINIEEKTYTNGGDTEIWWLDFVMSEPKLLVFGIFVPYLFTSYLLHLLFAGCCYSSCVPCGVVKNKINEWDIFLTLSYITGGEIRCVVYCNINSLR